MKRLAPILLPTLLICLASGCATRFSPEGIRREITLQRGQDPLGVFELSLGRFTTLLIKSALAGENGDLPFAGLREIELAVYEAPTEQGPAIDVTRIAFRGWESVIRAHDESRSALVLIRSGGFRRWGAAEDDATIGDLVVVGAGRRKVVYARLRGSLSARLPSALGDALRQGGPTELQRVLTNLTEEDSGG